ncbi:FtsX-like permease family protein [Kibdelosporangium persicum]|uniref:Efflux ABC transporter permease component n=1 Tax=Kibdelosporangium persicum TaxID=2698649 RepID=A0ABX2EZ53_9PSEU|nr:FtsX-like permease family protein [Kibdelosporangium persicum]NRN64169.1 Efflux ABC transporter permease component [Kibdelosporangium persicum]
MNPLQLAWRVLRGDSRSRMSALFTAIGVAVGVTLVLWLATVPGALQSRADRESWRNPTFSSQERFDQQSADAAVLVAKTRDNVGQREIQRFDVAGLKPDVPVAAGIPGLPGPGEVLLSPALADLAGTKPADQLADRFKGTVVGRIGPEALMFPDELVAIVGHDPSEMPNAMPRDGLTGTGSPGSVNKLLVFLSQIGIVVLIAPCLVLVASAARLTAARRERRLAALRLAGATPQQVIAMTAAETAIASIVGAVLGVALTFPMRELTALIPWDGGDWFPSDWTPSGLLIGFVLVVAPLLVVGAAVLGLRRAVNRPLGAAQQQTKRQPNAARLLWLVGAAVAFVVAISVAQTSRDGGMTFVLIGLSAVAVSLVFVGPLVTSLLGKMFTARWRSPATLLAGRRLMDDPKAAFRASAGVVLAVFAGSMALAMFPSIEERIGYSTGEWRDGVYVAQGSGYTSEQIDDLKADLASRKVDAPVVEIQEGALQVPGARGTMSGTVLGCADAGKVLGARFDACHPGPAIYVPQGMVLDPGKLEFMPYTGKVSEPLSLPQGVPVREYNPAGWHGVLIDPAVFGSALQGGLGTVAVATTPANQDIVHTMLVRNMPGVSLYSNERYDGRADTLAGDLQRATLIGLSIATVLGGVSAGVAAAGSVVDRRRTFGALIAAGTPVNVLTRALRREAMLPALVATLGAGVAGVLVGSGLLTLIKGELDLNPWIVTPAVLGLVVALMAAAACGPVLRRVSARDYSDE